MEYAEKIYAQVKRLPAQAAQEVLDFAEFVARRHVGESAAMKQTDSARRRAEIERVFSKYRIDLGNFKFDREEINARH